MPLSAYPRDFNVASHRVFARGRPPPRFRCMCPGRGEGLRCLEPVDQGGTCPNCFYEGAHGEDNACACNCEVCCELSSSSESARDRSRTPPAERAARTDQQAAEPAAEPAPAPVPEPAP